MNSKDKQSTDNKEHNDMFSKSVIEGFQSAFAKSAIEEMQSAFAKQMQQIGENFLKNAIPTETVLRHYVDEITSWQKNLIIPKFAIQNIMESQKLISNITVPKIDIPEIKIPDIQIHNLLQPQVLEEEKYLDEFYELLMDVNPQYLTMLKGARDSLKVDNAEGIRHCCVSVRELFDQLLSTLSPEGSNRRERIKNILKEDMPKRENFIKFIDSVAELSCNLLSANSEMVHAKHSDLNKMRKSSEILMRATEEVIYLILINRKK